MEFNYLVEKRRMLEAYGCVEDNKCGKCPLCPIGILSKPKGSCIDYELNNPYEAISIVYKWAEENPMQTMLGKFKEMFPNAKYGENGIPFSFCPHELGWGTDSMCSDTDCVDCWNRPYVE